MSSADDFDQTTPRWRGRPGRSLSWRWGPRWLLLVLAVIALIIGVNVWARWWTQRLWFDSVGYSRVFRTQWTTESGLFVAGFLLTGAALWFSMRWAYTRRPFMSPDVEEQDTMRRYRAVVEPVRRTAFWLVPTLVGLLGGTIAMSHWQTFLLWWYRVPFGETDPHFHYDIGFYVFTLPWLRFLVGFATMILVLSMTVAVLVHYLYGGLSLSRDHGQRVTSGARVQLAVMAAVLVLIRGVAYWLDRLELATQPGRLVAGVDYTAAHAQAPMRLILAAAAVICAALFAATVWTRTWRLPIIATVSMLVLAIVLGGIYPALVRSLKVTPSQRALETPYLQRSIAATRSAYGLTDVQVTNYAPDAKAPSLRGTRTLPGARLLDPYVVAPAVRQQQARAGYYQFPDVLDVDRYPMGGASTDVVVGVRGLDVTGIPAGQRNWINEHTVYTHGYGMVVAKADETSQGEPSYVVSGLPPQGNLGNFESRVYFGESAPDYSIVGGASGSAPTELDYPSSTGDKRTTYTGRGGVALNSALRRAAYAVKYGDYNLVFSDAVNDHSRLLDVRDPAERVRQVAPWLTLDGNPYPVIAGGRIVWVVDGYTTTDQYPGSKQQALDTSTADALTTDSRSVRSLGSGTVNYIRNSVKATVDAYDGTVKMYAWDDKDPILKVWRKAFGGTVLPESSMPAAVQAHVRYPEDLFKVQRQILAQYHVTDPSAFFSGTDFWQVPDDPTRRTNESAPPYYQTMSVNGSAPTYSMTTTYIPTGARQNLAGVLTVNSDAGSTPGQVNEDYGKLTLQVMPRDTTVPGPGLFLAEVSNSTKSAPSKGGLSLAQYRSNYGDRLSYGNVLTIPLPQGILYVAPLYVRSAGNNGVPTQDAVLVKLGDRPLGWGATLADAIENLFQADSGSSSRSSGSSGSSGGTTPSTGGDALAKALADVQKYLTELKTADDNNDRRGYQAALANLQKALARAQALAGSSSSGTASPSGSASPSPSSTSTPTSTPTG